jgi:hypothetical protein
MLSSAPYADYVSNVASLVWPCGDQGGIAAVRAVLPALVVPRSSPRRPRSRSRSRLCR